MAALKYCVLFQPVKQGLKRCLHHSKKPLPHGGGAIYKTLKECIAHGAPMEGPRRYWDCKAKKEYAECRSMAAGSSIDDGIFSTVCCRPVGSFI